MRISHGRPGEAALAAPYLVSWTVFRNPVVLIIGGVAVVPEARRAACAHGDVGAQNSAFR